MHGSRQKLLKLFLFIKMVRSHGGASMRIKRPALISPRDKLVEEQVQCTKKSYDDNI